MSEKKHEHFNSPDISKLKAVVIDRNTVIYISPDDDPEEARKQFKAKLGFRKP